MVLFYCFKILLTSTFPSPCWFLGRANDIEATFSKDKISSNVKLGLYSNKMVQIPAIYAAEMEVPLKLL